MRLRTLKLWHRYKKIWLALLGWAAAALAMLLLFGWAMSDQNGGLGRIEAAASWEIKGEDIERLEIKAGGLRVEIAASVDSSKVRAYLYGEGYVGEQVRLYQRGSTAFVTLAEQPPVADSGLTLRIIVPKREYARIDIALTQAEAVVTNLRGDLLNVSIAGGRLYLDRLDIKEGKAAGQMADIMIKDCAINDLALTNHGGDTTVSRSKLRYWTYDGDGGDLLAEQKSITGVWQLAADSGDITVRTSRTPYNLLCELVSDRGKIVVGYKQYDWDELTDARLQEHYFQGVVGEGSRMLLAKSVKGNITVENK